jgi:hypothetical protein
VQLARRIFEEPCRTAWLRTPLNGDRGAVVLTNEGFRCGSVEAQKIRDRRVGESQGREVRRRPPEVRWRHRRVPSQWYFWCHDYLVSLSLSYIRGLEGLKHQVRMPKGNPDGFSNQLRRRGDDTKVGIPPEAARRSDWGLEWMQRRVCQGPKYGPQVRVVFIAPAGCIKSTVLSLQLVGTLEPCPRAPHWRIRRDLPGKIRPSNRTVLLGHLPGSMRHPECQVRKFRPQWDRLFRWSLAGV